MVPRNGQLKLGYFLARGEGPKKRFQYCLNPNSSEHFLYFRAIQGHSGGTPVDPTLQDHVLLPDDFAEHIYDIGNAHDMHSIIQGGLIPGGRSLKRDRQSVFFTAVNPMYANQDLEEVQYDLVKPRNTVYKNTSRVHQDTVSWCKLKLAQSKGLQFYQTRSHAIALVNTLPATCIEKVVCMKVGEDLYCKVRQSPRLPRVALTPNPQNGYGRQILIPKRENPPTITANKASNTGKLVAHFLRTHVASIPETVSEVSKGKLVAVTLSTEFQVYLIQPSKKRLESQGNRQKTGSTIRESPEQGFADTGFEQDWRVQSCSAKSRLS